ncbi:MAG: SMI1/KNR4 family protein [Anaerolineae bacterium]|nr:SMI1/KNR4 family protein [Anaerolineae bacterium]
MNAAVLNQIQTHMQAHGVVFAAGMTDAEIARTEAKFGFRFPPDLKQWLQHALPISSGFPDWRAGAAEALNEQVQFADEGVLCDVEHNQFWAKAWGERPATLPEALAVAKQHLQRLPKLIPIYKHRFISSEPHEAGNAVLSIMQTDIIYYGADLSSYLSHEFHFPNPLPAPSEPRRVPFWSDLIV